MLRRYPCRCRNYQRDEEEQGRTNKLCHDKGVFVVALLWYNVNNESNGFYIGRVMHGRLTPRLDLSKKSVTKIPVHHHFDLRAFSKIELDKSTGVLGTGIELWANSEG
jgi:hypothetical protein